MKKAKGMIPFIRKRIPPFDMSPYHGKRHEELVPDTLDIQERAFAYFPQGGFVPGGPRPRKAEMPLGIWSSLAGWTTQGLAHFYRATGYELAGELAEFVRQSFEWAKTKGQTTVGYFPENIDNTEYEGAETCQLAGMIGLALKLSQAGLGDYWDDAGRWIRNQFAENQLRRADWVYRVPEAGLTFPRRRVPLSAVDPIRETTHRVPERDVGAFAGWPSANDFFNGQGSGLMHCCTGNGTRALYRDNPTRWKKATRFVSDQEIYW